MKALTPEETEDHALHEMYVPVAEFAASFGLAEYEVLEELRAGRLVASGRPVDGGGYEDIAISLDKVANWLASASSPAAKKASVWIKEPRR